jgi:DNA-binding transcriptional LysR family regulator
MPVERASSFSVKELGAHRTIHGERLLQDLEHLLPRIEEAVRGQEFEPSKTQQRFRVPMTDYASLTVLPRLTAHLAAAAPGIAVEAVIRHDRLRDNLESGRIDLILEAASSATGFESTVIFEDDFICLVSREHPFRGKRLSLKQYLEYSHVVVNVSGGHQSLVDRPLADLGLRRRVGLTVPYFLSGILSIQETRCIVTVPRRLTDLLPESASIRVVEPPRELSRFNYVMGCIDACILNRLKSGSATR